MDEMIDEGGPETSRSTGKWVAAAFALIALGAAGYYALSGSGEARWGDASGQPAPVVSKTAEPVVPAARPAQEKSEVRGVVQAAEEATLASRMTARITAMPYRVGSRFPKGAALVELDCSQLRAELAAANAATAAYQKTYETNVELDQYEAVGTNEVAVSKANLNKARAEGTAVAAQLRDCRIIAPFSGTVVEEIAHRGEVAASGQPLLKLQSGGALEAELIVPSKWLKWVKPGIEFAFAIDETGEEVKGVVKRLGASVDPVSKTIRVTGDLFPGDGLVLPGMSGTATFASANTQPPQSRSGEAGADAAKKNQ